MLRGDGGIFDTGMGLLSPRTCSVLMGGRSLRECLGVAGRSEGAMIKQEEVGKAREEWSRGEDKAGGSQSRGPLSQAWTGPSQLSRFQLVLEARARDWTQSSCSQAAEQLC